MTFAVDAVDAHAEGQPGRVVVGGVGRLAAPGATMFEKMKYFEEHGDWFRLLMLREPRGYPRSCVNVLLPPTDPRADAGFVIMEQSALYATMSGTNLMAVTTVLLETGLLQQSEPVTTLLLEVPAGLIEVRRTVRRRPRDARRVRERAVVRHRASTCRSRWPASARCRSASPGAAWRAPSSMPTRSASSSRPTRHARWARRWSRSASAAREQIGFRHPLERRADGDRGRRRDGTAARDAATTPARRPGSRRARWTPRRAAPARRREWPCCTRAARSPSERSSGPKASWAGSSGCGIVARDPRRRRCGRSCPRIGGRAWITGYATYVLQDDDPFPEGFVMGDIWPAANAGSIAERLAAARRGRPD